MKQIFEPYWLWEDYRAGMFDRCAASESEELTINAAGLLSDCVRFREACDQVVDSWPIATAVNLTNKSANRRAWLGQASCCLVERAPETVTREAWKLLTDEQRYEANKVADEVIREYEAKDIALHRDLGEQRVLQWHP